MKSAQKKSSRIPFMKGVIRRRKIIDELERDIDRREKQRTEMLPRVDAPRKKFERGMVELTSKRPRLTDVDRELMRVRFERAEERANVLQGAVPDFLTLSADKSRLEYLKKNLTLDLNRRKRPDILLLRLLHLMGRKSIRRIKNNFKRRKGK